MKIYSFKRKTTGVPFFANFFIAVFLILSHTACEDFFISEVDSQKVPNSTPKLVVNSYISPQDSIIRVFVNRSLVYSQSYDSYEPVHNKADVYLAKKGNDFLKLEWYEPQACFIMDADLIGVEPDNYYVLKVESFKGEVVDAECYVPHLDFSSLVIGTPYSVQLQWGGNQMAVDWQFKAAGGNYSKYYSTDAFYKSYWVENYYGQPDTIFGGSSPMYMEKGKKHFMDDNGYTWKFTATGGYYDEWGEYNPSNNADSIVISVLQSDIHYYRFHKSVETNYYYGGDSPFAEPVHIYTNINGGLGVFAGYNRKDSVVSVR